MQYVLLLNICLGEDMMKKAQRSGSWIDLKIAEALEIPSCDELYKYNLQ